MEINKAVEVLENHNKWRRNTDDNLVLEQSNPTELGIAIETIVRRFKTFQSCKEPIIHEIDINGICKDCGKNLMK
jgi:hypothetical protein